MSRGSANVTRTVHFVGLWDRGSVEDLLRFQRAVRAFGPPTFVHRHWDVRAITDVAPDDVLVFGAESEWNRFQAGRPREHAFNDSEVF